MYIYIYVYTLYIVYMYQTTSDAYKTRCSTLPNHGDPKIPNGQIQSRPGPRRSEVENFNVALGSRRLTWFRFRLKHRVTLVSWGAMDISTDIEPQMDLYF